MYHDVRVCEFSEREGERERERERESVQRMCVPLTVSPCRRTYKLTSCSEECHNSCATELKLDNSLQNVAQPKITSICRVL